MQVPPSPVEHAIDLPHAPAAALRALGAAAEEWGADFAPAVTGGPGGELRLPVVAGLRRGLLSGPVAVKPAGRGSRLVFRPVAQDYYLETTAIALLSIAAAGALLTVAWPLFPRLLPVAPLGAVLAVGGWFLVLSRLRGQGPEEFLASVAGHAGAETGAPGSGEASAAAAE
ncbi:MAG TPA: hypothetical protein VOA80_02985 [Thermoanaerobaculia bacterium]|nr:hypothetical protein [Thermoanaerobaculia bacterium]